MRSRAPGFRGLRVVMQDRQRPRQTFGVGTLEAGAADYHVEPVLSHIDPDPVPQQFDGALVAVARQHAGSSALKETQTGMTVGQARYVELVFGVEAAMICRHLLAQQA